MPPFVDVFQILLSCKRKKNHEFLLHKIVHFSFVFMYMVLTVNIVLWNIVTITKKRSCVDIRYHKLRKLIKKKWEMQSEIKWCQPKWFRMSIALITTSMFIFVLQCKLHKLKISVTQNIVNKYKIFVFKERGYGFTVESQ